MAVAVTDNRVTVSVDTVHKPGSTTERRPEIEEDVAPLWSYEFQGHELLAGFPFKLANENEESQSVRLTNLLYGLENLRKRDGEAKELE